MLSWWGLNPGDHCIPHVCNLIFKSTELTRQVLCVSNWSPKLTRHQQSSVGMCHCKERCKELSGTHSLAVNSSVTELRWPCNRAAGKHDIKHWAELSLSWHRWVLPVTWIPYLVCDCRNQRTPKEYRASIILLVLAMEALAPACSL